MRAVILYSPVASEVTAGVLRVDESQVDMSHDVHSDCSNVPVLKGC